MDDDDALLRDAPARRADLTAPPASGPAPGSTATSARRTPPTEGGAPEDPRLAPGRALGAGQRRALAAAAVLLLVVGGWFGVRAVRGTPVELSVDGEPIVNALQMVEDGASALRSVAAEDGAPLVEGAGCWFAPAAETEQAPASDPGPRLACGPVRLGVAGDEQTWLVATPTYAADEGGVRGTVRDFDRVEALEVRRLARPGGGGPPDSVPEIGTEGIRSEAGRLITNAEAYVDAADAAFADVAAQAQASTAEDSRCWLGVREVSRAGRTIRQSTGQSWCGPVLTRDSAPGTSWAVFPLTLTAAPGLVGAVATEPGFSSVPGTTAREPGVLLVRPDGEQAPERSAELEPPPAAAQEPGYAAVLDESPTLDDPVSPEDGRLVVPELTLALTGLSRTAQLGSGPEALVAAEGETLVVATYTATRPEGGPSGTGTATLVVDGARTAFPAWTQVADGRALVVSVPSRAAAVDLEVLSDGRAQTISLLTGRRAPGAPAALYRTTSSVGVGAPVDVRVPLPEGPPAGVEAAVAEVALAAWLPELGWAPPGTAHLTVSLSEVQVDEPCCDVPGLQVEPAVTLTPAGGATVRPDPRSTADAPVFRVPEGITSGVVTVAATATSTAGPIAPGAGVRVPFTLPR